MRKLFTAAIVAAAVGFCGTAAAQTEIKISHQWKQGADSRDKATRIFVEEAAKKDPTLKFRIYPGRSLVSDPRKQIDGLQDGTLEMAVYPLVYATGKVPEFSITIMPGTVKSMDHADRLKGTPFHKKLQEVAHKNGIHVVTWWWTPGGFASRDREITGPDSVKGLKMRAADPYFELILKNMGASIQSMASTEIYPALQSGVLDGVMTSAESFVSMRIYEQTKHATAGGDYTLFMLLQPLVASKKFWDSLTDKQRAIMEEAATASEKYFNGDQRKAASEMVDIFKKNKNAVRPLTDAEYKAWVAKAREVAWPKFAAESPTAKELLDLIQQVN